MSHFVAPASFEHIVLPMPEVEARPLSRCCQEAVADAMETTASMGSIATVTVLMVGFAVGLSTAWVLFG